jgi:transcriptional regulator with XRE-family HTH domain
VECGCKLPTLDGKRSLNTRQHDRLPCALVPASCGAAPDFVSSGLDCNGPSYRQIRWRSPTDATSLLDKSQDELAKALGITFQQVQKYEKGVNRISASRLQRLCCVLQVPVSFFFDGAPPANGLPDLPEMEAESEAAAINAVLATSDGIALATAYARIRDTKVRRAIVALVEQIAVEPDSTVH